MMDARLAEFAAFAAQPDAELSLCHGALLFATDEYPNLNVAQHEQRLQDLGAEATLHVPQHLQPEHRINALNDFLFNRKSFRGNRDNYYDPRNSYLNDVLDRGLGIPISLAVVYMEVSRQVGLGMAGIGLPGHFMCKCTEPGCDLFIDVFNGGRTMVAEECLTVASQISDKWLTPAACEHFLRPISVRRILFRMLLNLKGIFVQSNQLDRAIRIADRLLLLVPSADDELRDRGLLQLRKGDERRAAKDLSAYLQSQPAAADADSIRRTLHQIATRGHRLN
ncbi:MAG: tetratricopeptide repeat protein [Candidatus Sumerlaeaceae bacterium]|nr:tetratricopeptide repeat protein [Candidatus Sumerlaeaceae bacterium]